MEKVRVGIIGCGGIANGKHMPALKKVKEVQMVAFCDIIPERAEAAVKQYGNAITAAPAIETIITVDKNEDVTDLLDRQVCRLARAPRHALTPEPAPEARPKARPMRAASPTPSDRSTS